MKKFARRQVLQQFLVESDTNLPTVSFPVDLIDRKTYCRQKNGWVLVDDIFGRNITKIDEVFTEVSVQI